MEENIYTPGEETNNSSPLPIPQITLESLRFLNTAAQWAKFLAVMGFIGIGMMLIVGLIMGAFLTSFNNLLPTSNFPFPFQWLGVIYIVLAVVYLFPVIYLNNFSNYISKAVAFRETEMLTIALENIKKYFKFTGIVTIVMVAFSILFPIILIILISTATINPQHMILDMPH